MPATGSLNKTISDKLIVASNKVKKKLCKI